MLAIIDYGAGNLFSVKNALDYLGIPSEVAQEPAVMEKADGLILPGVGAFPDAMRMLTDAGWVEPLRKEAGKKPLLGICLGMQLLFELGMEFTQTGGLGLVPGRVDRIETSFKVPHMGYNELEFHLDSPLLQGVPEKACVYFVHSYMAVTLPEYVAAYCDYGVKIPALVQKGHLFGAQFHPEKSGEVGLTILKNFGGLTK